MPGRLSPSRLHDMDPKVTTGIDEVARVRAAAARVATRSDEEILIEARRLGPIVSGVVGSAGKMLAPGTTTARVADLVVRGGRQHGLEPAMLGYNGFEAAAAISVNDEILHAPPSSRVLAFGDLVKIQYTAVSGAAFAAQSWTFPVGLAADADQPLL